ncbi:PorT family protein [Bacteroidales bacterium]|nr:PorT family protein [Bacteroidales bacterium]
MRLILYVFVFSIGMSLKVAAQESFKGGLKIGIVGSQIDGDTLSGYSKANIHGGLWVERSINEKISVKGSIQYSERGVLGREPYMNGDQETSIIVRKWRFYYVDLPVTGYFKTNSKFTVVGGVGFAYLFGAYIEEYGVEYNTDLRSKYNRWDYTGIVGINYPLLDKLTLDVLFQYSLMPAARGIERNPYMPFNKSAGFNHNLLGFYLNYEF